MYKDGLAKELLAASQAALKQAEMAYTGSKADVAKQILADAQETFEKVGVFPDSKVSPITTLKGNDAAVPSSPSQPWMDACGYKWL